jgi:O-antigen/teichoic acid export membrane protein
MDVVETMVRLRPGAGDLEKRFLRGALWSGLGTLALQSCKFGATILLARLVGRESFGHYSMAQSTLNAYLIFANAGVGLAAAKLVAEYKLTDRPRAHRIASFALMMASFLGLTISVSVGFASDYIAISILGSADLIWPLRAGALLLLANTIESTQIGVLSGMEDFKSITYSQVVQGLVGVPAVLIGAYAFGIVGALTGGFISTAASCAFNYRVVSRSDTIGPIEFRRDYIIREWRRFWAYALPALLAGLPAAPSFAIGMSMIASEENGYSEAAIFSAAYNWRTVLTVLPTISGRFNMPILSTLLAESPARHRSALLRSVWLSAAVTSAGAAVIFAFSERISSLYGRGYADPMVFGLVVASAVISVANGMFSSGVASRGCMWTNVLANTLMGTCFLLVSASALAGTGARRLSLALIIAEIVLLAVYLIDQYRGAERAE